MIEGACHCGQVHWSLSKSPEYATSCNCTLCRQWGALWAYGFKDEDIQFSGVTHVYMRDPKTIEFHLCQNCGCVAYWCTPQPGQDGRYYLAVNLRLASPDDVADIPVSYFDGLHRFEALPLDGRCVADVLWA